MRAPKITVVLAVVALAGCGGNDDDDERFVLGERRDPSTRQKPPPPAVRADISAALARVHGYCVAKTGTPPEREVDLLIREYRKWPLGDVRIDGEQTRLLDVVVEANEVLVKGRCSPVLAGRIYSAIERRGDEQAVLQGN
jgi:hypothetical protein